jgi:hypothetical protein
MTIIREFALFAARLTERILSSSVRVRRANFRYHKGEN